MLVLGLCGRRNRVVFAILDDSNTGHSHNANGNLAPFVNQFGQPIPLTSLGNHPSAAATQQPVATAPGATPSSSMETGETARSRRPAGAEGPADGCRNVDDMDHAGAASSARHDAPPPVLEPAAATLAALRAAKKWSAGLIPYRQNQDRAVEVLLGRRGGPFWKSKHRAWSILKGEPEANQRPTDAFIVAVSSHAAQRPL